MLESVKCVKEWEPYGEGKLGNEKGGYLKILKGGWNIKIKQLN